MCDVTRSNFETLCPKILESIRKCSFISFDAEFTVLKANDSCTSSLFDDGAKRYNKIRQTAKESTIIQVGLCIFTENNFEYEAETYNFYLCPRSIGSLDKRFLCQASSLEFLSRHDFDFQKTYGQGISFMNRSEKAKISREIKDGFLLKDLERNLSHDEEDEITAICQALQTTQKSSFDISDFSLNAICILYQEIKCRYPHLSCTYDKKSFQVGAGDEFEDPSHNLIVAAYGFSVVIEEIINSQKPVVGHNCFSDLVRIYQNFIDDLPLKYQEFKENLHPAFPAIYDTKHLAFIVKRLVRDCEELAEHTENMFWTTSLNELYKNVTGDDTAAWIKFHMPTVKHSELTQKYAEREIAHEAGYDAFMSGVIFIRMAHIMASFNFLDAKHMKPLNFYEHLQGLEDHCNQLNIGRGTIPYVNIHTADPISRRPTCLFVTSILSHSQIAEMFARYGSVDVKPLNRDESIVAVSNHRTVRDILLAFENDARIHVTSYNPWKHDKLRKKLLMGACGASAVTLLASILILWQKVAVTH